MKMARALDHEYGNVVEFMTGLSEAKTKGKEAVWRFLRENYHLVDTGAWERVVHGYKVLHDHAADPELPELAFKPEILQAMKPDMRLALTEIAYRNRLRSDGETYQFDLALWGLGLKEVRPDPSDYLGTAIDEEQAQQYVVEMSKID